MNRSARVSTVLARLNEAFLLARPLVWRQASRHGFGSGAKSSIGQAYVINLDRQRERWRHMVRELRHIRDSAGNALIDRTTRFPAVDALEFGKVLDVTDVIQEYTLGDQLFVDPRTKLPPRLDLSERVNMSRQEVAVAQSHINVWRTIANGADSYALVLEDDIRFRRNFCRKVDSAWSELTQLRHNTTLFDVLYLSYKEVDYGAEKVPVTEHLSRLFRGVWYLSGYVLSKRGANRLLERLPVRGPVDMWMNHQFSELDVLTVSESVIDQRSGEASQNLYSILPVLSRMGILNTEGPGHFYRRNLPAPVIAIGPTNSGMTSISMALSMLGYRCCSDLESLPRQLLQSLLDGQKNANFDAYVNIGTLPDHLERIAARHPNALLINTAPQTDYTRAHSRLWQGRVLSLPDSAKDKWKRLCEFVRTVPPACPFPDMEELGQRRLVDEDAGLNTTGVKWLEHDDSPWVRSSPGGAAGVRTYCDEATSTPCVHSDGEIPAGSLSFCGYEWRLRSDTFQGNLAMFDPDNVVVKPADGIKLITRLCNMGVRQYSSANICSRLRHQFGKFTVSLRPPNVSGLVTGLFLHRNSPRQEIDIEFLGNAPDKILANVFYNPGCDGDRFDYGYRGSPCLIDLGFDYSSDFHEYSLEWSRSEIRWLVDGRIVHRRANWAPTPIPHLPMDFHVNVWPTSSTELAGCLDENRLPASAEVRSIQLPCGKAR